MGIGSLRWVIVATLLAVAAGCASKKPPPDKPLLTKIAVVPATERRELSLKNENGIVIMMFPISSEVYNLDSKGKARVFNEQMAARKLAIAAVLNATVIDSLRNAGYELEVHDKLVRPADDPDDIDLATVKTDADMILQLRVDDVGLHSPKMTQNYIPRVNFQSKLYVRSRDDSIYDEDLYYGLDAKDRDAQSIRSDPKYSYPTFDDVMARQEEIARVFAQGAASLSELLARQLREALETKARRR